jgi:MFS family permease
MPILSGPRRRQSWSDILVDAINGHDPGVRARTLIRFHRPGAGRAWMTEAAAGTRGRPGSLVAALCVAEVLGMAGFSSFAALLPFFTREWALSNTEAGWIGGIYYAGYTAAVPVLVSLTDRADPRRIYLLSTALGGAANLAFALAADGFWSAMILRAVAGVGLAGTYMPGLKALTDRLEGTSQARAVAFYTSSFGIGGSASFVLTGVVDAAWGWRWAFAAAALGSALGYVVAHRALRSRPAAGAATAEPPSLLDVRPVVADRTVMACVVAYAAHNFELFGFRAWIVAFLAFSASQRGVSAFAIDPALVAAGVTLVSLPGSIIGNEIALRLGRRRTIIAVMSLSASAAAVVGFAAPLPLALVVVLTMLYGGLVSADSSALTSSLVASAQPRYRGMTMAVYSTLGFAGAFLGPLAFGIALDLVGAGRVLGWCAGFATLGAGVVVGPLAFLVLGARPVEVLRAPGR